MVGLSGAVVSHPCQIQLESESQKVQADYQGLIGMEQSTKGYLDFGQKWNKKNPHLALQINIIWIPLGHHLGPKVATNLAKSSWIQR